MLRTCVDWVLPLLRLKDNVLETCDADIAIDIKFVSIHKSLLEQTQVGLLLELLRLVALLFIFLVLLCLDTVWDDLRFLGEDV